MVSARRTRWAVILLAQTVLCQVPASQQALARAYTTLSDDAVRATAALSTDDDVDFTNPDTLLAKILIPRAPGSQNLSIVQDVIRQRFEKGMSTPWAMVEDRFDANTPIGAVPMTNLIFTHDPEAERKLVLAAHIDSKYYPTAPDNTFVGATDSAAPVAIIISAAQALSPWLDAKREADRRARERGDRTPRTTLSILILDGEEAFRDWTHSDSIYGAKHLAELWAQPFRTPSAASGSQTALSQISTFVLLDLLGAPAPKIRSFFHQASDSCADISLVQTGWLFDRLIEAEDKLASAGLLRDGVKAAQWKEAGTDGSTSFFEPRNRATANQWVGQIEGSWRELARI